MTREDALLLTRCRHQWPIWWFVILVYYIPALIIAFMPDPCVRFPGNYGWRIGIVVFGCLAGIAAAWCQSLPKKARAWLEQNDV